MNWITSNFAALPPHHRLKYFMEGALFSSVGRVHVPCAEALQTEKRLHCHGLDSITHGQKTVCSLSHGQMLWLAVLKGILRHKFNPWSNTT